MTMLGAQEWARLLGDMNERRATDVLFSMFPAGEGSPDIRQPDEALPMLLLAVLRSLWRIEDALKR